MLSYYGHFLAVTKVLLNRLNKNSRDYTASQYEQLRAFCVPDPTRELQLFHMDYVGISDDDGSAFRVTYADEKNGDLMKKLTFKAGDEDLGKTSQLDVN